MKSAEENRYFRSVNDIVGETNEIDENFLTAYISFIGYDFIT